VKERLNTQAEIALRPGNRRLPERPSTKHEAVKVEMRADFIPDLLNFNARPKVDVEFFGGRAFRLRVVQPLRPSIMDKACALWATSDHPLNRIHLPIEWRSRLRFFTQYEDC
jgi:hypothetical protein